MRCFEKRITTSRRASVAEFLIFDSQFPRSIRHCITKAQVCLHRISGSPPGSATNLAEKRLGRLKADLEYTDIDEVIDGGMHEFLDRLQTRLNEVDAAIGTHIFQHQPPGIRTAPYSAAVAEQSFHCVAEGLYRKERPWESMLL